MKRFVAITLIFAMVFVFTACKNLPAVVAGTQGKEYESTEDKNSKDESASQSDTAAASQSDTAAATQDETSSAVTTAVSDDYLIVDKDTIKTPAYNYEIPKDFEIKSKGTDPLLENKQGTVQLNIMDKTESAADFDTYVEKTYNSYKTLGVVKDELKDITIADIEMKRFGIEIPGDDGVTLTTYTYAAQVSGRTLMITVTAKNGELTEADRFDEYIADIDFARQ